MTDYIFTDNQLKRLSEIYYSRGGMDTTMNSYEAVFRLLKDKKGVKDLIKSYLKDELGYPEKVSKSFLDDYFVMLKDDILDGSVPKVLKSPDVLSNLAYYLASNIWGLKKVGNLEVLKKISNWEIFYVFFDPTLKLSIGKIVLDKATNSDLLNTIKVPKKTYKVTFSFIDKELKGSGYGKEMYFSLLEDLDMLVSDQSLYENSANIWVNILPINYSVFAVMDDTTVIQVKTTKKPPKLTNVHRYFAVKDINVIKFK